MYSHASLSAAGVGAAAPVDRAHLDRQTMGDGQLAAEVLALFAGQAPELIARIRHACGDERRRLAHTLKGSAHGVGAFTVAACAEAVEAAPSDDALISPLDAAVAEALAFII